jgi:hypothetical protein
MIKRKSNPGEVLIVVSKLKGYIAGKGMRTGGDLAEALSEKVKELIDQAIVRTKAHKQQTVTSKDL